MHAHVRSPLDRSQLRVFEALLGGAGIGGTPANRCLSRRQDLGRTGSGLSRATPRSDMK